jgi:peptidoglycan/LPS O-acetylase OafA/YrhL
VTGTYSLVGHTSLIVLAIQVADQGVAIFFLISGFLLYRPFLVARLAGRRLGVRDFAARRALRIIPAYWFALTLFIAAGLVSGVTTSNWWIFYGFLQVYRFNTIGQGIGVAWTLCIEVTFYAALPIFALVAGRLGRGRASVRFDYLLLLGLSVGSLAFRAHFDSFADLAAVSTLPGTFCWFAFGMALAALSVTRQQQPPGDSLLARILIRRPTVCWALAAVLFAVEHRLLRAHQTVIVALTTHVLYGFIALLILIPGVFDDTEGGWARRVLRLPALAWIGLISYAFYLYHTIVIAEINKLVTAQQLPARYPVVLIASGVISCACAAASYYLLERPVMRLGRASRGPPARSARPPID